MYNKQLLSKLCTACGISGDEGGVRKIIEDEITPYVSKIFTDPLGNLIALREGRKRPAHRLMIAAHMDEVGFIVTDVTDDGYIKFASVGGIDKRVVLGKSVLIGANKINGVVCLKPVHLCSSDEATQIPEISDMYISVGADSREEALGAVSLGDSIVFNTEPLFDEAHIMSKAIDDRAGCYMLCEMIKNEPEYDTYFAFTVQEEVGLRGARTAAYTVDPEFALVVESTTASDLPDVPTEKQVCCLGGGAVVSFMDRATIYDKGMYAAAFELAKENGILLQTKRAVAGGNDSGAIHTSREGVRTLAVSLPCRYLHSSVSMISAKDLESAERILPLLAQKVCSGEC